MDQCISEMDSVEIICIHNCLINCYIAHSYTGFWMILRFFLKGLVTLTSKNGLSWTSDNTAQRNLDIT